MFSWIASLEQMCHLGREEMKEVRREGGMNEEEWRSKEGGEGKGGREKEGEGTKRLSTAPTGSSLTLPDAEVGRTFGLANNLHSCYSQQSLPGTSATTSTQFHAFRTCYRTNCSS